ncbi:uncharacterized protein LOC118814934 isoform X1 [Colossoma macropomum]|uniref:uncharacterized protein LOC118814934 isoform X1 n=1 Tax=Colossoma macropomum TaxID=42526 RepID=UPI001863AB61|nr:uncharacterized protein LOC118814934 isoform X1 [Colossoma macropomum]
MKITPTVSYLWTCTLLLYTLIRECPADSEMITSQTVRARLGHSASLTCQAKEKVNVVQSQWSRCPDHIILVYKEQPGAHVVNQSYNGHVSTEGYHTLILNRVQEGDFGEYCCKLTTYPSGSLEGRVLLLEEDEKEDEKYDTLSKSFGTTKRPPSSTSQPTAGLPVMMIVYISCGAAGFVVLMGIIIGLVCRKRRRKVRNPIRVPVQPSGVPQNKQEKGDPVEVCDEGDDDEGGMYLNVPQLDS